MTKKTPKIPDCNCGHEFSKTSMYHLGDCPRKDLPKQPMCGLPPNAITTAIKATADAKSKGLLQEAEEWAMQQESEVYVEAPGTKTLDNGVKITADGGVVWPEGSDPYTKKAFDPGADMLWLTGNPVASEHKRWDIKAKESPTDPDHYHTAIEPIEYIMANGLDFCEGNVIKYITRWQKKGGVEDLKKAKVYIQFLIDKYEEDE